MSMRGHVQAFDRPVSDEQPMLKSKIISVLPSLIDHFSDKVSIFRMHACAYQVERHRRTLGKIEYAIEFVRPSDLISCQLPGKTTGPAEVLRFGEECFAASERSGLRVSALRQ